jgi:hypothetical protein
MPFAVAGAGTALAGVAAAGASMYDANQSLNAQKAAIAPLQGAQKTTYAKATDIANTPYTPYTGTQVAPLSGNQQRGIGQATTAATDGRASSDIAGSEAAAGQIAGNGWNSATAQKYMNPYTQNVTDIAQRQLNKTYANTINNQGLSAASRNAFGGDRAALTDTGTTQGYLQDSADTAAKGQAAAYDNATKTWQADNARSSEAASAYSRAGNDVTNMNSSQIKDLLATGGVEQATNQMDLNAKYNTYLDQRGWAANQLQPLLTATGNKGTPAAVPTQNKASDLLGMGTALAGYFGSKDGGSTPSQDVTFTNPDTSAGFNPNAGPAGFDTSTMGPQIAGTTTQF